jgi:hypothetical protein
VKPFGKKVFKISFVKHVLSVGREVLSKQVGLNFGMEAFWHVYFRRRDTGQVYVPAPCYREEFQVIFL